MLAPGAGHDLGGNPGGQPGVPNGSKPNGSRFRLFKWLGHPVGLAGGWLITSVLAAGIGAATTSLVDRAQPDITISDIRLSAAMNHVLAATVPASVANDKLFTEMQENPWLVTVDPNDVDNASKSLQANAEKSKQVMQLMADFREAYPFLEGLTESAPTLANSQMFFDKWESLDAYIYGALKGIIQRGTMQAIDLKEYPAAGRHLLIDRIQTSDTLAYGAHKPGGMHRSVLYVTNEIPESVIKEVIYALAYFDQPVLRQYLDAVKQDADRLSDIQSVQNDLSTFEGGYSRLSVSVLLTNSGSKTVSFSPEAMLYVNTLGAADFSQNTAINVNIYDDKGNLEPVTLNGGETKLFVFTSKALVLNMPSWRSLLGLFNNASRNCFIAVRSEGEEWNNNTVLLSGVRSFGVVASKDTMTSDQVTARFARQ